MLVSPEDCKAEKPERPLGAKEGYGSRLLLPKLLEQSVRGRVEAGPQSLRKMCSMRQIHWRRP